MNESQPSSEPGSLPPAQSPTSSSKTPLKNIAFFLGSMAAAYVIVQGVKLFIHPWLVTNGLWPF